MSALATPGARTACNGRNAAAAERALKDKLLDMLACPICKAPLEHRPSDEALVCRAERLAFPIRDGIPVLLEAEARTLSSVEVAGGEGPVTP